MSISQQLVDRSGDNNPMYGRTGALSPMYGRTGANHPIFGITPTNALSVNVNSLDGTLVNSFSSRVAAAKWLGVSDRTVLNYIRSGKEFKGKYILSSLLY
jgi:NUMOD1 domain